MPNQSCRCRFITTRIIFHRVKLKLVAVDLDSVLILSLFEYNSPSIKLIGLEYIRIEWVVLYGKGNKEKTLQSNLYV